MNVLTAVQTLICSQLQLQAAVVACTCLVPTNSIDAQIASYFAAET